MILLLSGGGEEAREISLRFQSEGVEHLCFFPSFADAGNYGKGNAYVGKLTEAEGKQLLRANDICGVIDAAAGNEALQSLAAMSACAACGIPYIKYLRIPKPEIAYDRVRVMGSLGAVAEAINDREGAVLFYATPKTVHAIAKRVLDQARLFTPIQRGLQFDVELALEFGIPLLNVMENDGIDGEEAVTYAIQKAKAALLVCDTSVSLEDKLNVAKNQEIPVMITHENGIEYTKVVHSADAVMAQIRTWK